MSVEVRIEQLPHSKGLPLPAYETSGSVGLDLRAAIPDDERWLLASGKRMLVPTGLKIAIPDGYEAQIRPRSGLALRHGIFLPNSPGTIDCDYRGEIQIILANSDHDTFEIKRGMRIAQLILAKVEQLVWCPQSVDPAETIRGADGFGSTGVRDLKKGN